jgi:putative ABC transport system permease protein
MTGTPGTPTSSSSRLFRAMLRLVPWRWRESVERDLLEEASRAGRRGLDRHLWLIAQAIAIAFRMAGRSVADRWRARPGWRQAVDGVAADLRVSLRGIVRQPWSAATIVVTLALGMSATTAVFAVFNHVLYRPIPGIGDPEGLATIYFQPADRALTFRTAPRAALHALREADAFTALAAATDRELVVVSRPGADAALVRVEFVTDGYFEALRVRPRAGRLLTAEDHSTRRSVAMISERWWRRELNGDPLAIGRSIELNREPVTIVGIMADYRGWGAVRIGTIDVWMPFDASVAEGASVSTHMSLVGRLRPAVTPAIAEQRLRGPFAPFAPGAKATMSIGGFSDAPPVPIVYPGLHEINQERTRGSIAELYPFALGAGGLLLLLACANTANLLLARTMARARDLGVRSALGASRWRLARGQLIEAAALVAIAAGAAVLLARMFVGVVQGERLFTSGPALDAIALDWRVLAFVGAVGALTVVLFGLLPALAASRPRLPGAIALSSRVTRGSRRLRAALVCVQLALAVMLLAGAGVLVRTMQNLRGIDLGMNPDGVVSFEIAPMRLGYSSERRVALVQEILDRLQRAPGVESAASAAPSPFSRGRYPASLKVEPVDEAAEHEVSTVTVSADYFETLRIRLRAGRSFTEAEARRPPSAQGVGIVNESLARQLFGETPAVGRHIYLSRAAQGWSLNRTIEIVGVAGDTRFGANLRATGLPALYEPGQTGAAYFVRSSGPAAEAIAAVRAAVREVEPGLPLADVGPIRATIDRLIPEERVLALLVGGIAAIAMLLGVVGVHAVISHTVAERTREFGIRIALGAPGGAVLRGVLRGVAVLAVVGLACGLALFAVASRLLESRIYGVSTMDPLTLAGVTVLLVAAALAGAWLPAIRATRVDPAVTLRVE